VEEQAKCQFVLKTMDLCMCLTWLKYKLGWNQWLLNKRNLFFNLFKLRHTLFSIREHSEKPRDSFILWALDKGGLKYFQ
jgi:hypothetical protein